MHIAKDNGARYTVRIIEVDADGAFAIDGDFTLTLAETLTLAARAMRAVLPRVPRDSLEGYLKPFGDHLAQFHAAEVHFPGENGITMTVAAMLESPTC